MVRNVSADAGLLVYLETFGCQMNENDSARILGFLGDLDCKTTESAHEADVIIINTCSVRDKAEHKVFSLLGRLKEIKQRRAEVIIGVAGCVAQQLGGDIFKRAPYVDLVFGPHNIHRVKDLIRDAKSGKRRIVSTDFSDVIEDAEFDYNAYATNAGVKTFVSVMRGCDNFCSYCIVPYTRGREASRRPDDVVAEVRALVERGVKEVTLVGQNVNSYGAGSDTSFPELLKMTAAIDGLKRLRFMTSHPKDISDELIGLYGDEEKLCAHIHLPVQSGSDRILKAMRRGYSASQYADKIDRIRAARPDIGVSTDIIAGFPGESDADFNDTMRLVETLRFDNIFSFAYSQRPGTDAAGYDDHLEAAIKHERLNRLQERQKEITTELNSALIGKSVDVLVEGRSTKEPKEAYGRTPCNRIANFTSDSAGPGRIVRLRITGAHANAIRGVTDDAEGMSRRATEIKIGEVHAS